MNIYFRKIVNKNWIQSSDFSHYEFRRSLTSFSDELLIFVYATIFFYTIFLMPIQLLASAAFFVLLWAKNGSVGWEENWEVGDNICGLCIEVGRCGNTVLAAFGSGHKS